MRRRWTFLLLALLLASCAPREGRTPSKPAAAAQTKGDLNAVESKRELTLIREPQPASRPAPPPVSTEQTLPALSSPELLPEDFSLGRLQDFLAGSREERGAAALADRFLSGLSSGEVPAELLVPELREELEESLAYYLDQGLRPVSHRLGALSLEESQESGLAAWMKVRLFSDTGASQGELYLNRREGKWYVSDLQVSFPLLGQSYERKKEKFMPSDYGWRIE